MSEYCIAKKADNTACKAFVQAGSKYCVFHDPTSQKKLHEARIRGNDTLRRNNSTREKTDTSGIIPVKKQPKLPRSKTELGHYIMTLAQQVVAGKLTPQRADAAVKLMKQAIGLLPDGPNERQVRNMSTEEIERQLRGGGE